MDLTGVFAFDAPAHGAIVAHRRHRVATVNVHEDVLIRVRKGRKILHGALREWCVGPGELVVLARGGQWDVVNDPDGEAAYEADVLQFGRRAVSDFAKSAVASARPAEPCALPAAGRGLNESLDRCLATLNDPACSSALRHHRVLEVLLLLAEAGCALRPAESVSVADLVRSLVSQRPHAPWSVEDLSGRLQLSPSALRRRLAEHGTNASALLRETRLETALALLQTTRLPVGEVASRCGYDSHSRFSAAFRQRFGFAPSALRHASGAGAQLPTPGG